MLAQRLRPVTPASVNALYRRAEDQLGLAVDPRSLAYVDRWLRTPDRRFPTPDLRAWYRELGLWLPLSCTATFVNSVHWTGSGTSSAKDFSACNGAGGLFVVISSQFGGTAPAPSSDTGSNAWTSLTSRTGSSSGALQMHYKLAPSASATHTFTNGSSSFGSMIVLGFSGITGFDQESGANATVAQPGSITPGGYD